MAKSEKKTEQVKPETKSEANPELETKKYPLITDVKIGGKMVKKGTSVSLTEKGRKYFKSLNYIK